MTLSRYAVFVDGPHLWNRFARLSEEEGGAQAKLAVDAQGFADALVRTADRLFPRRELLRVYWYGLGMEEELNRRMRSVDGVKVRCAESKTVDAALLEDLLDLAQNGVLTDALLLTDSDGLVAGVNDAQALGVRVLRLEVAPDPSAVPRLRGEADRNVVWPTAAIRTFLAREVDPDTADFEAESEADEETDLTADGLPAEDFPSDDTAPRDDSAFSEALIRTFLGALSEADRYALRSGKPVPSSTDKRLLAYCRQHLGRLLTETERFAARRLLKVEAARMSAPESLMTDLAREWVDTLDPALRSLRSSSGTSLPTALDRDLLRFARTKLQRLLTDAERRELRSAVLSDR